jgi:hypothetical protein
MTVRITRNSDSKAGIAGQIAFDSIVEAIVIRTFAGGGLGAAAIPGFWFVLFDDYATSGEYDCVSPTDFAANYTLTYP